MRMDNLKKMQHTFYNSNSIHEGGGLICHDFGYGRVALVLGPT